MMMCRAATQLMSLKQDRPLKFRERMALRFHLLRCDACRQCDRQFTLMHELGGRFEGLLERDAAAPRTTDEPPPDHE